MAEEVETALRELHRVRGQLSGALTMVNRLIRCLTDDAVAESAGEDGPPAAAP